MAVATLSFSAFQTQHNTSNITLFRGNVPAFHPRGRDMPFRKPRPEDIDKMHYLRTASRMDHDDVWLRQLNEEANARKHFHEAADQYAHAIAMVEALQLVREYGTQFMGRAKR